MCVYTACVCALLQTIVGKCVCEWGGGGDRVLNFKNKKCTEISSCSTQPVLFCSATLVIIRRGRRFIERIMCEFVMCMFLRIMMFVGLYMCGVCVMCVCVCVCECVCMCVCVCVCMCM